MRRSLARSAQIGGPESISQCFQVSTYSGEPFTSKLTRNLFSKDRWRQALGDEASKLGPEVPFVRFRFAFAGAGEWLAWATSGPHGTIGRPSSKTQCVIPSSDAGEEVAACSSHKVFWRDVFNTPSIDFSLGNQATLDQLP
jgi:hypothetical protein